MRIIYKVKSVTLETTFQLENIFGNCSICGSEIPLCKECEEKNKPPIYAVYCEIENINCPSENIYIKLISAQCKVLTKEEWENRNGI